MSKRTEFANTDWQIIVQSGGISYPLTLFSNGTLQVPGQLGIKIGGFKGTFIHANTADRNYQLQDRNGTIAFTDSASLLSMLPAIAGNGGKFFTTDGTTIFWATVPAGGITTFNGLTAALYPSQNLAIGVAGTAPAWVSATGTHTLNIPMALTVGVTAGLLSNTDYANIPFKNQSNTFNGTQTFDNAPIVTTPSTANNAVATYGQLQTAKAGLSTRPPVAALDSSSLTLPTVNPVIDGRTIQLQDRVLATALTAGTNRVYKATGALGAVVWTLETDGQAGDGTPTDGDILFVRNGTLHADQQWAFNGSQWVLYNVAQSWNFSTGLTVTGGNTISVTYGTIAGTACQGNDTRLTDSRTPTAHTLDGALHTITGKTAGQVMIATSATAFGFVSFSGDVSVNGAGLVQVNQILGTPVAQLGLVFTTATLTDNTATATATGIAFPTATTRNAKIEFSIARGAGNYSVGYIQLLYDGTNARITQCEDDSVGTTGIVFTADVTGGNMRLLYTTTATGVAATMKFTTIVFPQ